ncbi:MAG TPA: DUF5666 domain-containing protein [Bacillota bacterium]|nr:DUF5666 domain-containing protein [Bacillota bacterium]
MITIKCWRIPREYLVLALILLLGVVYLSHWYNSSLVMAGVDEDVEVVLNNQVGSALVFNSNLIQGFLVKSAGDSLTLTQGSGSSRLPDSSYVTQKSTANSKDVVTLRINGQTKLWKGGRVSFNALQPGDVVYAEVAAGPNGEKVVTRAWVNLGQYQGKVSQVQGDKLTLDAGGESEYFLKLGNEGRLKSVVVTGQTKYLDGNRQNMEFKDIKLGDTITAIGTWDKEGVLTATKVIKY